MLDVPGVSALRPLRLGVVALAAAVAGCGGLESRIERARRLEARYIAGQGHERAEQGDLGGAARAYAAALAADPRLVTLHLHLGYAYERLGGSLGLADPAREETLRRAALCHRQAADSVPAQRRHALLRLAGVHGPAGLGELGLLEGDLAELVLLDRPEADWFLALARLREDRHRLDESEAALLAARDALPHAALVHEELARFYRRHERLDAFFAALEQRLEGEPDDREALYALIEGCFYRAFRDYRIGADRRRAYVRRGIEAAERLLRLDPEHAEARRYRDLLSGLRDGAEAGRDPRP
jgi:hypothetical protein